MDKNDFAFGRLNYAMLVVGVLVVIAGYALMAGKGSTATSFNPEIFSPVRIKVAPLVVLAGFVWTMLAVMVRSRGARKDKEGEGGKE